MLDKGDSGSLYSPLRGESTFSLSEDWIVRIPDAGVADRYLQGDLVYQNASAVLLLKSESVQLMPTWTADTLKRV